jgi:hypothetical protein
LNGFIVCMLGQIIKTIANKGLNFSDSAQGRFLDCQIITPNRLAHICYL